MKGIIRTDIEVEYHNNNKKNKYINGENNKLYYIKMNIYLYLN